MIRVGERALRRAVRHKARCSSQFSFSIDSLRANARVMIPDRAWGDSAEALIASPLHSRFERRVRSQIQRNDAPVRQGQSRISWV